MSTFGVVLREKNVVYNLWNSVNSLSIFVIGGWNNIYKLFAIDRYKMLDIIWNSVCGWTYWGISKLIVLLLWLKYYGKEWYYGRRIEHQEGEKFNISIQNAQILGHSGENELVKLLQEKGDVEWREIFEIVGLNEMSELDDKVLRVDFTIDSKKFIIHYSYKDRWEYPVSFPPYTDTDLENDWKNKDYKHSVLVAEIDGKDVTEVINKCLGPLGNMFEGKTGAIKTEWLGGNVLTIIDNEGNDYEFKGVERVVFHKK